MSLVFVQSEGTAARRRFPVYLVDATDGITPETGEAAGQPQISKNGGAFANTSATLTAVANGAYYVELTATELDTLGTVIVRFKSANTAEFNMHATVVAANVHDNVRLGLTALPNAAAEAAGGLYTQGTGAGQIEQKSNGRISIDVDRIFNNNNAAIHLARWVQSGQSGTAQGGAAGSITLAAGASSDNAAYVGGKVVLFSNTGIYQVRQITAYNGTTKVATVAPNWGTNPDATTGYVVIPAAGRGLSLADGSIAAATFAAGAIDAAAIATDAIGAAELATDAVNEIRDSIISDATTFAGANIDAAISSRLAPTTAGRTLDVTATGEAGVDLDNVNGTLDAADIGADAITAAKIAADAIGASELATDAVDEIRDGILNRVISNHTTLGTVGQVLNGLAARTGAVNDVGPTTTDFDVDGFTEATNDHFNGMVMTFTSGVLTGQSRVIDDYTGTGQNMVFGEPWTEAPANNDEFIITDGPVVGGDLAKVLRLFITILDQATGQIDSGSFAAGAIDAAAIGTGAIDADSIATDAITAAKIAANAIGASEIANGAIDAATFAAGAIDAAAIATDAIGAAELATDAVNEIRDSILSDATTFAGANIDAAVSTRATPAQVNTEVLDVMNVDTFSLPGQAAPPLTPTLVQALTWLFKVLRNRTDQTSSLWQLYADNETTVDAKATVSDDGTTAVKQEIVSGP